MIGHDASAPSSSRKGLNVLLAAMPVNGRLIFREPKPQENN
jgi:hypothetical protein